MLHTIVPLEQIFTTEYQPARYAWYGGAPAEYYTDPRGGQYMGRLYTTDLSAYLGVEGLAALDEKTAAGMPA